jgi:hypothetical protein
MKHNQARRHNEYNHHAHSHETCTGGRWYDTYMWNNMTMSTSPSRSNMLHQKLKMNWICVQHSPDKINSYETHSEQLAHLKNEQLVLVHCVDARDINTIPVGFMMIKNFSSTDTIED